MQVHEVQEVFTPASIAKLTFVERESVRSRITDAVRTPGKQLVIYGRSGYGKSTLVENKLQQLYSHHIVSLCTSTTTLDALYRDALDQLRPYYEAEHTVTRGRDVQLKLGPKYAELSGSLKRGGSSTSQRLLPPQFGPRLLSDLLDDIEACWVLEDFHKVRRKEKERLGDVMKNFVSLASQRHHAKIIAIGATRCARQLVTLNGELLHRVAEIEVPPMTSNELEDLLLLGERRLNIHFTNEVKTLVEFYANGLASIAHQLCLNMCRAADIHQTLSTPCELGSPQLLQALNECILEMEDSLRPEYQTAIRRNHSTSSEDYRRVLHAVSLLSPSGGTAEQVYAAIKQREPAMREQKVRQCLDQLCAPRRGQILSRDRTEAGTYAFTNPMMHAYTRMGENILFGRIVHPRQLRLYRALLTQMFHAERALKQDAPDDPGDAEGGALLAVPDDEPIHAMQPRQSGSRILGVYFKAVIGSMRGPSTEVLFPAHCKRVSELHDDAWYDWDEYVRMALDFQETLGDEVVSAIGQASVIRTLPLNKEQGFDSLEKIFSNFDALSTSVVRDLPSSESIRTESFTGDAAVLACDTRLPPALLVGVFRGILLGFGRIVTSVQVTRRGATTRFELKWS